MFQLSYRGILLDFVQGIISDDRKVINPRVIQINQLLQILEAVVRWFAALRASLGDDLRRRRCRCLIVVIVVVVVLSTRGQLSTGVWSLQELPPVISWKRTWK